jgi:hypothetical protein
VFQDRRASLASKILIVGRGNWQQQYLREAPSFPQVWTASQHIMHWLTSSPDGRTPANLSSTHLSVHSSANDRHNIITHSLESLHVPLDQPSRLARATHREPGQGWDTSQSIERQSRSSPIDGLCQYTHPDIDTSNISFDTHVDDRIIPSTSPAVLPSLTSVVVDVHDPTTEPLPTSSSTNPQRLMDEPYVIGSPPARYPSSYLTAEEPSQRLTPASSVPDTQGFTNTPSPIHSGDVPRYNKDIRMQVNNSILPSHVYTCWQTQKKDTLRYRTFDNDIPLVSLNTNDLTGSNRDPSSLREQRHSDQPSLNQDRTRPSSWEPATHPNGALYFFDCKRVRASVILKNISPN